MKIVRITKIRKIYALYCFFVVAIYVYRKSCETISRDIFHKPTILNSGKNDNFQ